jgi:hypothetical protein
MSYPANSTLGIHTPPTLAIDPGSRWTGIAARQGNRAINGAVVGLFPGRTESDHPPVRLDDFALWHGYFRRITKVIDEMWDRYWPLDESPVQPWFVVEAYTMPKESNSKTLRRIGRDTFVPIRELAAGLAMRYDGAVFVLPNKFGGRHNPSTVIDGVPGTGNVGEYYGPELTGRRPDGWFPNDHPSGTRNHEQAAFDIAAAAHEPALTQAAAA